jgi:hypothetical protein
MMSNIQRLKNDAIQNGQLINAEDINIELNQLVNKANELDDAVYQNKTFTGNKTFNGTTLFQQGVTLNGGLTLEGASVNQSQLVHWGGPEQGVATNQFDVTPPFAPVPLPDGYTVAFRVQGTPSSSATLSIKVGANAPLPLLKDDGLPVLGMEASHNETIMAVRSGSSFTRLGSATLPTGHLFCPIPEYVDGNTVSLNGWFAARAMGNQRDFEFLSAASVTTATTGLNGLETGVVSPNTWYTLKAVRSYDATSQGFVWSLNNSTSDVTLGGTTYRVRPLPLTVRTDANGAILPFVVAGGWPYQPEIRYTTVKTGYYTTKLATEADTRVLVNGAGGWPNPVTVACSSFVPSTARIAHLALQGVGGGGAQFYLLSQHDADANTGISQWNDPAGAQHRYYMTTLLDSTRSLRYKTTGGGWTIAVLGYTITNS